MADDTLNVTQPLHTGERHLLLVDNGDDTYSLAASVQDSALPDGASTSAKQDTLLTELQGKADLDETQPVTLKDASGNAIDSHACGDGGYHVGVNAIISGNQNTTRHAWITTTGAMSAIENSRLVGTNFDGTTKDTNFWTETVTNNGSVTQNGGITLATSATANGTAKYESTRKARFVVGYENHFLCAAAFTTAGTADNVRRIGPYDTNEGFFFQLDGTTFSVGYRTGAADTLVSSGSFNGNGGSTYAPSTTLHKFEVEIMPLAAFFYIDGVLIHTISGSVTASLTFPVTIENINDNGLEANVLFDVIGSAILRKGPLTTNATYYHLSGNAATHVLKYGGGVLQKIVFNNTSGTSITIYDNTSAAAGAVIGIITTSLTAIGSWDYDVPFNNGLTLVTVGNGLDATIVYE